MTQFRFRRDDDPPPRRRVTEIKKFGPTDRGVYLVLADKVRGFHTHWLNDRTQPCQEDRENCPGCRQKAPDKWCGYLHVIDPETQKHWFLELTEFAKKRLDAMRIENGTLRGLFIHVQRERAHKRAPLQVTKVSRYLMPTEDHLMLAVERDPLPTLMRIWGLGDLDGLPGGPEVE